MKNVLQLVFSSYTLSLTFDSMTKMDDWYIALQIVTGEERVTLQFCHCNKSKVVITLANMLNVVVR